MAAYSSSLECEKECRDIHASWNQLNQLGLALARRTTTERRRIRETYKTMYGEDLIERLCRNCMINPKNEVFIKPTLLCYFTSTVSPYCPAGVHAVALSINFFRCATYCTCGCSSRRSATPSWLGMHSNALSSTTKLSSRSTRGGKRTTSSSPSKLTQPCARETWTKTSLVNKTVLLKGSHHDDVSQHIAKCDAKRLYDAGKVRMGTVDEPVILEMFSKRSIPQLSLAFSSYKHIYGHDYINTLKKDCCGEFEDTLRVVVKCIYNPAKYYSKMVHTSMKGPATDKRALTRVILGSIEVGMEEVKTMYEKRYGKKVKDAICELLPEDDYRDFLVALTNGPISTP